MTQQQKIVSIVCGLSGEYSILPVSSILDTGMFWSSLLSGILRCKRRRSQVRRQEVGLPPFEMPPMIKI